jgi:hypothetical protein
LCWLGAIELHAVGVAASRILIPFSIVLIFVELNRAGQWSLGLIVAKGAFSQQ